MTAPTATPTAPLSVAPGRHPATPQAPGPP